MGRITKSSCIPLNWLPPTGGARQLGYIYNTIPERLNHQRMIPKYSDWRSKTMLDYKFDP